MAKNYAKSWDEYRRDMIRETERFIEYGLKHPELVIEIPAKPVGDGGYPRQVADWFWHVVLTSKPSEKITRVREMLRRRPKFRLSRRKY